MMSRSCRARGAHHQACRLSGGAPESLVALLLLAGRGVGAASRMQGTELPRAPLTITAKVAPLPPHERVRLGALGIASLGVRRECTLRGVCVVVLKGGSRSPTQAPRALEKRSPTLADGTFPPLIFHRGPYVCTPSAGYGMYRLVCHHRCTPVVRHTGRHARTRLLLQNTPSRCNEGSRLCRRLMAVHNPATLTRRHSTKAQTQAPPPADNTAV
jgi:hypothetical protein